MTIQETLNELYSCLEDAHHEGVTVWLDQGPLAYDPYVLHGILKTCQGLVAALNRQLRLSPIDRVHGDGG